MKFKLLIVLALALVLFLTAVGPSFAATTTPSPGFGNHVSCMATTCSDPSMIGQCTSSMASGAGCICGMTM